ncbi:MAG: DUF1573 domain-containing protein [Bacteroidota bacterium]
MKTIVSLVAALMCLHSAQAQYAFEAPYAAATSLSLSTPGAPAANWEANLHDFGQIVQGQPVSHTFFFTNTGDADLLVNKVKPSCGCTVAEYSQEAIAPGEQGFVTATYSAKGSGYFTKSITVFTNEGEQPIVLRIKGETLTGADTGE